MLNKLKSQFSSKKEEFRPNNYYPFWNMKVGEQAIIRFLPDKNENNPLGFLTEKLVHNLKINGEDKKVPCLKMYEENCPICNVSSSYYKQDDKVNGKKYYKSKQHIAQALVIEDPLAPNEAGETHVGKVRFIAIGFQLFQVIKEAFESGELDDIPFGFKNGCNFIIKKTKQGTHDNYAIGSKFARKVTDLTEDQIAEIQTQMIDLSTLLPKHPGTETVESMLEAALTGAAYAEQNGTSSNDEPQTESVTSVKADKAPKNVPGSPPQVEAVSAADAEIDREADDILARIRNRKKD